MFENPVGGFPRFDTALHVAGLGEVDNLNWEFPKNRGTLVWKP